MDQMEAIKATFYQECEEQLSALESGLLSMEGGDTSLETVNAVFRAVHSVKGGAGAFKLNDLVNFAHTFETLLDLIRSGKTQACSDTTKLLLRAADVLADLVRQSQEGDVIDPASYASLLSELNAAAQGAGPQDDGQGADEFGTLDFTPAMISIDEPAAPQSCFTIGFKPHAELYGRANDPLALFMELERLGQLSVASERGHTSIACAVPVA